MEVMTSIYDHWANVSKPFISSTFGSIASIAFQPLPRLISEATRKWGDNFIDMGTEGHRIVLEYDYSYVNGFESNAQAVEKTNLDLINGTRKVIANHIDKKNVSSIFINPPLPGSQLIRSITYISPSSSMMHTSNKTTGQGTCIETLLGK
jgi:hypothetical protein